MTCNTHLSNTYSNKIASYLLLAFFLVCLGSDLFMFLFSLLSELALQFPHAEALATELITRNACVFSMNSLTFGVS